MSTRLDSKETEEKDGLEKENEDLKENKIAGWIFFLIVGMMMMIYSVSADDMNMAMDDLFQKIIGIVALAFIVYLVVRKLTK